MSKFIFLSLLLVSSLALGQEGEYHLPSQTVPKEFQPIQDFLEHIKWDDERAIGYDKQYTPKVDLEFVDDYLLDEDVWFTDPNNEVFVNQEFSRKEILKQLKEQEGQVYDQFSHLGHIYAQPYKQYSLLSFESISENEVIVHVATWYTLVFEKIDGKFYLKRLIYEVVEGC